MATRCGSYLRGRMMRVTRLDGCGRVIYGPDSVVTSKGMVTVTYTANIDEGEEVSQPNAAGERCVYDPAKPAQLGYTVEIEFCQVDPEMFSIMTGQDVYTNAFGDVTGVKVNTSISSLDTAFSLEVWMGSASSQGCAQEGGSGNFGYLLLPFLQGGVLGDVTVQNGAITFTISNASTRDGNAWGVGPYNVDLNAMSQPAPLNEALLPDDHLVLFQTQVAPPEAQCGARPLLDPDGEDIGSVEIEIDGLEVGFDPDPSDSDAWWIDFGDGVWDYSDDGSTITHEYEQPGTYTYTAFRGGSQVEGQVTVPSAP